MGTQSLAEIIQFAFPCLRQVKYHILAHIRSEQHTCDGVDISLELGDEIGMMIQELVAPARLNLIDGAGLEVAVDARGVDRHDALCRVH